MTEKERNDMTDDMLPFPPDPDPCEALSCAMRTGPVDVCRDHGCCYRWMREACLDRKAREEKDKARGEEG